MLKYIKISILTISASFLFGCSSGDLRAFNDAMTEMDGHTVTYPDQSDVEWLDDIKWINGIKNGSAYTKVDNTGYDYCRVRLTFENDNTRIFNLAPKKSSGRVTVGIYNQAVYIETLCNTTSDVFNSQFK